MKERVYQIIEVAAGDDRASRYFDVFIMSLITLNVIAVILDTVAAVRTRFSAELYWFEIFSVGCSASNTRRDCGLARSV